MKKMLGEELVSHGVINEAQLDKALKAQLIHGGHLGTCLIELGYINEQRLGETLAIILGVEHAEPQLFHSIPSTVLDAIPRDLAVKHRVVPFRLDERTIHVAMVAPRDLAVIDELQFATGQAIRAWVAPEIRIVLAMENYYGVPRSRRFLLLSPDPFVLPESKTSKPHATPATAAAPPVWADLAPEESYAEEPLRALSDAIDELGDAMCAAADPGQLGASILDCVSIGLQRSILFRVHKEIARIWDSRGFKGLPETSEDIVLPVVEEPVFGLLSGRDAYLGPPTGIPADGGLYGDLGAELPSAVLLLPVYLDDHLVAVLYGDSGPGGSIEGSLPEYQRVAHKIGPALEIQALARRVRRL